MLEWMPKSEEECRRMVLAARSKGPAAREAKIRLGDYGEELWRHVLFEAGYRMNMLCKIEDGGAPLIRGKDCTTISPDYDCYRRHERPELRYSAYIDSKVKGGPVLYENRDQFRHGINKRSYEEYMRSAELDGKLSGLVITELFTNYKDLSTWSGALLVQSFKRLGTPYYSIPGSEPIDKAYWRRNCFVQIGVFGLLSLNEIARGARVPDYSIQLDQIFNAREQGSLFA